MIKRISTLMFVLILSAGVASAGERLDLSGQMRVQGFAIENYDDLNGDVDTDKEAWFAMRFRLGAKLNVMEGVTANLRFDFSEDTWGSDNWSGARYGAGSELQVDRAYLQVDQKSYMFKIGQLYQGLGNSIAVDQNTTGLTMQLKLPVTVDLMYAKFDENGANNDDGTNDDSDFYAFNVGYAQDKTSFNAFVAMVDNKNFADDSATIVFGLQGATELKGINLNAELNVFTGNTHIDVDPDPDDAVHDWQQRDAVGTQLYVDANITVADAKVGGLFLYAMGTDKADEIQMTHISDFGSFSPLSFGILDFTDWGAVEDGFGRSSFAICGNNTGAIVFSGYAKRWLWTNSLFAVRSHMECLRKILWLFLTAQFFSMPVLSTNFLEISLSSFQHSTES